MFPMHFPCKFEIATELGIPSHFLKQPLSVPSYKKHCRYPCPPIARSLGRSRFCRHRETLLELTLPGPYPAAWHSSVAPASWVLVTCVWSKPQTMRGWPAFVLLPGCHRFGKSFSCSVSSSLLEPWYSLLSPHQTHLRKDCTNPSPTCKGEPGRGGGGGTSLNRQDRIAGHCRLFSATSFEGFFFSYRSVLIHQWS